MPALPERQPITEYHPFLARGYPLVLPHEPDIVSNTMTVATVYSRISRPINQPMYVTEVVFNYSTVAPCDASNYWTVTFNAVNSSNVGFAYGSINLQTVAAIGLASLTVNTLFQVVDAYRVNISTSKVGAPGSLTLLQAVMWFRPV